MPFKEVTSQGLTFIRLSPTSLKGGGGFYSPHGECAVRGGGGVHLGACVGTVFGGAASGCAGFDVVYE
jgi:hypothetical protein